jgi:hypothetical protein
MHAWVELYQGRKLPRYDAKFAMNVEALNRQARQRLRELPGAVVTAPAID